jgi:hypothetical protein
MSLNDRKKRKMGFGNSLMEVAGEFEKAGWPIFFPAIVLFLFGIVFLLLHTVGWFRH